MLQHGIYQQTPLMCRHMQGCWNFCGVPAARERLLVQMRCVGVRLSRAASECVFAQMFLPANNQKEALKLVSFPPEEGGKVRVGFLVLRYSWIFESLLRITISHPSRHVTELRGDPEQHALMCKGWCQEKKNLTHKHGNKAVHMYYC